MRCSNAENYMYEMGDLIEVWDDIKGVEFKADYLEKQKHARHYVVQNAKIWMSSDKPVDTSSFYGIMRIDDKVDVSIWASGATGDNFIITHSKQWQLMLKAVRTQNYSFLESVDPINILEENKNIPSFVLEYCAQM